MMGRKRLDRTKNILTTVFVNIARIVVGGTLLFSGFVKAVDPMGMGYKFEDYAIAIGIGGTLSPLLLIIAGVLIAMFEFTLGTLILLAIERRATSRLAVVFMTVMTLVTVWIFATDPVEDCGCFGDAIVLTNGQTLLKNLMLLALSIIMACYPLKTVRFVSRTNQWIVVHYVMLFSLFLSAWCLYDLPIFDFRPYHIGADIRKGMEIPKGAKQPEFETTFILEKDGVRKEFTLEDYPDSTWTFVDSRTKQISEGYVPEIHDFDVPEEILQSKGYSFLLISPHFDKADESCFGEIDQIYEYAMDHHVAFLCLTASSNKEIQGWRDKTGAEYDIESSDETTLKTVVRSNPGLLLLKDGVIVGKWSHSFIPSGEELKEDIAKAAWANDNLRSTTKKSLIVIAWFFIPLLLLTIADRLWAWSQWMKKNRLNIYRQSENQLKNKKL